MKSRITPILILAALGALSSWALASFEVVSIKAAPPDAGPRNPVQVDSGRVRYNNMTVRMMIQLAYGVPDWKLAGEPGWVDSVRYDIAATFPAGVGQDRIPELVRSMLADRFGLVTETQTKTGSVYVLKQTRGGARLKAATLNEQWNENGTMNGGILPGRIILHNLKMAALAELLARQLGKPVVDQTGLEEVYDVDLKWAPSDTVDPAISRDAPSLVTALQEQLGLRLEAAKAPVELLVVKQVSKPVEN